MIYDLSKMDDMSRHQISLSCVNGFIHYHDSKYYRHVVDEMLEVTEGKWSKAVKWWVSNSARAMNNQATGFYISLDNHAYVDNKLGIGWRAVKSLLDFLEKKAYIHIYKGYVESWKVEGGKRIPDECVKSCIILRERSLSLWGNLSSIPDMWKEMEESACVEVKNRKTKEILSTKGKVGIKEARSGMIYYNDSLKEADISFAGRQIATVQYKRVFLDSMDIAGRVYAQGGGVQLLPQKYRSSELKIDGEPVVELDYSAIHPNICYQMLLRDGLNVYDVMGKDFHPYNADLSFVEIDNTLKQEWEFEFNKKHDPRRALAKLAILIGMNSVDDKKAIGALSGKIYDDRCKKKEDQELYAITEKVPCVRILEELRKHNSFIGGKFFSDQGVYLQNIDSKIVMEIVNTMVQKGHTVLVYHDSVLTKQSAEQDLHDAMFNAWKTVLGDTTFCKVDKK